MSRRRRYAVIPTHDRPEQFATCLRAVFDQVDHVIVIRHHADYTPAYAHDVTVIDYIPELPNISEMWNLGLLESEMAAYAEPHDVAVLNDDAIVPPGWFDTVVAGMRATGAVAGCADQHGRTEMQHLTSFADPDITRRLSGFAFILDGSKGLRFDEQFRWWWGDTDMDWRARVAGGTVLVSGVPVQHPNGGGGTTVGVLAQIAAEDCSRFVDKWGAAPW
jgi:GT2 family glycosyltransferase